MRCVDVNVLVYAHREDTEDHERYRGWLEQARTGDEPLGVSSFVLSGFVRVVTHPKVFREPTPTAVALAFADAVSASPSALALAPGPRHWDIFKRLCTDHDVRGNLVPDAFLAALAIEAGGTWYSADRGFARFPTLRWRHPLDEP
jgi:uncharacterized protein